LTATSPGAFTEEHVDIAREVADQLAIAIQQARLREQVQRHAEELERRVADRTRELSALYEVTAVASQALDLEATLVRTLEPVLEAMRSDVGVIHLLDEEGETLRLATHHGLDPEFAAQIQSIPTEGLGGWVIERSEPLVVSDVSSDSRMLVHPIQPRRYAGVPMRASGRILGVLSVLREATQPQYGAEEIALLTSIADQVGAVVESARLRQLAEQAAVLEERERLARDLHDSVTQTIFSMTLTAEATHILLEQDPTRVPAQLERLKRLSQSALTEMRSLIYQLRPTTGTEAGLVAALRQHAAKRRNQDGLMVMLHTEGARRLPPEVEETLFRIVQEALNNVVKHARTDRVDVTLRLTDESASLVIQDHGVGCDPSTLLRTGPSTSLRTGPSASLSPDPAGLGSETPHIGLTSMRERAEMLGGTFTIESQPGTGTRIRVDIPQIREE
jgi:signal transduction histidine kinase